MKYKTWLDKPWTCSTGLKSFGQESKLEVSSLHGDLSDQEEGQSRHPGRYRASRRGQTVDAVFLVVKNVNLQILHESDQMSHESEIEVE